MWFSFFEKNISAPAVNWRPASALGARRHDQCLASDYLGGRVRLKIWAKAIQSAMASSSSSRASSTTTNPRMRSQRHCMALQGRHDICAPAPDIVRANHAGEFIRRYSPLSGARRAPEICPCSNNYATTRWNTSDNPTQKNVTKIGENYK